MALNSLYHSCLLLSFSIKGAQSPISIRSRLFKRISQPFILHCLCLLLSCFSHPPPKDPKVPLFLSPVPAGESPHWTPVPGGESPHWTPELN